MIIVRTNVPQSVIGVLFADSQEFQAEEYADEFFVACNAYEIPVVCCDGYTLYGTSNYNAGSNTSYVYPYRLYYGMDVLYDFKSTRSSVAISGAGPYSTIPFLCGFGYAFVKEHDEETATDATTVFYGDELKYQMDLWASWLSLAAYNEYVVAIATDSRTGTNTGTRYIFFEGVLKFTWTPSHAIVAHGGYTFMRPDSSSAWTIYFGDVPLLTIASMTASALAAIITVSSDADYIAVDTADGLYVFYGENRIHLGVAGNRVVTTITEKSCAVVDNTAQVGYSFFEGILVTTFFASTRIRPAYGLLPYLTANKGGNSMIVMGASLSTVNPAENTCLYFFEGRAIWEGSIADAAASNTTTTYPLCAYVADDYVFIVERIGSGSAATNNRGYLYHKGVLIDGPFIRVSGNLSPTVKLQAAGDYALLEASRLVANDSYEVRLYYNQVHFFSPNSITSTSVLSLCGNIAFITYTPYMFIGDEIYTFTPAVTIGAYHVCCEDSLAVYAYSSDLGCGVVAQLTPDGEMYLAQLNTTATSGELVCCAGILRFTLNAGAANAIYHYVHKNSVLLTISRGTSTCCEGSKAFLHTSSTTGDVTTNIITKDGVLLNTPYLNITIAQPGCCNSRIFILVDDNTLLTYDDGFGLMAFNPRTFERIDNEVEEEEAEEIET